jgi:FkbH-like protein
MTYFVFRNFTVDPFFKGLDMRFSGYGDVSFVDKAADGYIWFYLVPYKVNNELLIDEIKHYTNLLELTLSGIDKNKQFLVFTMYSIFQIKYLVSETGLENIIFAYNRKIDELAQKYSNVKRIDIADYFRQFSEKQIIDWKYFFLAQISFNPVLASNFKSWFLRQLEIIELKRKKCIVVDLDNTLWAGVLGEDGVEGIKIGGDYPGNAYLFFQDYLREVSRHGIILAICSKNNETDVFEVFERHPDMILKMDDFVTYRINWKDKAENIENIAQELNIGLDSIVFIDDNPAEREFVKQMLPDVCIPHFPEYPYLYPEFIEEINSKYFNAYKLTDEDLLKTQDYKENIKRIQYKEQFYDVDGYLRGLEIKLTLERLNKINIVRFAQMTQKTNQFNLTTKRYTEADLQKFSDEGSLVYGLRVKDKFGDNGLTGLVIIEYKQDYGHINTFLLSCRILGRKIEFEFIKYLFKKLKMLNITIITASYVKTQKNRQVEDFYDKCGFEIVEADDSHKNYRFELTDAENIYLSDVYGWEESCGKES